ncbi:hypothetical protein B0H10DRAFT_2349851, partial [Mycena sp. CBHHK59/15]
VGFDVVARTLTVHGDESDVRRIRTEISSLQLRDAVLLNSTDVLCPVCFCITEDPLRLECGHVYCRDCLQHYLRPATQDQAFSPRRCIAEVVARERPAIPCGTSIPYSILRSLLSSEEEDLLLRTSFLTHINEHPHDFRYCPSADCQMVYRPGATGSSFRCPSCLIQVCPACNVEFHEGMSCAEHQDSLSGGTAALAEWRAKNGVKQCQIVMPISKRTEGATTLHAHLQDAHMLGLLQNISDKERREEFIPHE